MGRQQKRLQMHPSNVRLETGGRQGKYVNSFVYPEQMGYLNAIFGGLGKVFVRNKKVCQIDITGR